MPAITRPVSRPEDLEAICKINLRAQDIKEIRASTGLPPVQALTLSCNASSFVNVIELDGAVEGVWGLVESNNIGIPWFVCSDKLFRAKKIKIKFARRSLQVVEWMKSRVPYMTNFVMASHVDAIEWLEWLGFKVDKTEEYFLADPEEPFYVFSMGGSNV